MSNKLQYDLLNTYGEFMHLKIYIDSDDEDLLDKYIVAINTHQTKMLNNLNHIDAGFDLYAPNAQTLKLFTTNKVDYKIICSAKMVRKDYDTINTFNTGFYMYPRSSISKTNLRLANNTGIIDAGYRGHLIGMFDLVNTFSDVTLNRFERHLQICAPNLAPIYVGLVTDLAELGEETARKDGGFGSTGLN